jgi:hypothetical protein
MRLLGKTAIVLGMAGAVALGSMTASQARVRPGVAAAVGFAAGAAIGSAAAANSYYYGGPGYYAADYNPTYAYTGDPAYAYYRYEPGYAAYGYAPGYAYSPGYSYGYDGRYQSAPRHYDPGAGYNSNTVAPWQDWKNQGQDY